MKARITQMVAGVFSAAAVLMFTVPLGAQAAPLTPATAEGDSYGAVAIGSVLGGAPVAVGPVAASRAAVPPGTTAANQSGTVISGPAGPLNPLISAINVTNDTSKATLVPVASTDCQPNQVNQDGVTGPLSGGNACSTIASANALNAGTVGAPLPVITATGVFAQSLTQQCDPSQGLPTGSAKVVSLTIQGNNVTIPNPIPPNTTISVLVPGPTNIATVILNEQKLENLSGGQGLIVNAIHVFTGPAIASVAVADVVIGHTHSSATCTTVPATQACPPASQDPRCNGDIITKTDNTGNETAKPGQTITYSLSIDLTTNAGANVKCLTTQVTDTLPPGFTFVSASGNLGTAPTVGSAPGSQQQQLTFFSNTGFGNVSPLVETIVATIDANEPDGFFSNAVDTQSSCGENAGSSAAIHNIVTPAPVPTKPPLPNTGTVGAAGASGPGSSPWLLVILLGLVLSAVAAVRVLREGPID